MGATDARSRELRCGSMQRLRPRDVVVRGVVLGGAMALTVLLGVLVGGPAFALDPALDVDQYVHTSWKIRDGFAKSTIHAIAQAPDGYLWLATDAGLSRFDGVRSAPWPAPPGQDLPSRQVLRLLAARDGTLWIGTSNGLVSLKDGRLTPYPELAGVYIFALLEDREGVVWAGGVAVPTGRLCAIRKGRVECHGKDGLLGRGVHEVYEDSHGNVWAGAYGGLWRWKPGSPKFYGIPGKGAAQGLGEDDDGALLVGGAGGIRRFIDGTAEPYSRQGIESDVGAYRILRDRTGGLWIGTMGRGLLHVHDGRTDAFTHLEGLSGDNAEALLEDREGNLWVATTDGLDRFRDPAAATFSARQGLSNPVTWAVLAAQDGSVWLAGPGGLNRWTDGRMTIPAIGGGKRDGKVDGLAPQSLFQDRHGRIWTSTERGVGFLENERFTYVSGVPGGVTRAFAEDAGGTLWVSHQAHGLFGLSQGAVQQIPLSTLGHDDFATALLADPVAGGLWVGFFRTGLVYLRDGQVRASYRAADGLGQGDVSSLWFDRDHTLWASTEHGLSRLKDGRIATLTSRNGLPCDGVHWAMEDDARSFWLYTDCGLVRIARSEVEAWSAAVDKDKASGNRDAAPAVHPTLFDISDGVRTHTGAGGYTPLVAKDADGRLWFLPWDGVSVVDPRHLPFNTLPPPLHIEQVIADRKTYEASSANTRPLSLPALIRDLQIDYTALSLAAPEKVRFRYKLEPRDRDWQDAGPRRQAFYTDLRPGNYRFRMTASNNSGVWNEAGTSLDFSIAPAYYQATWFRLAGLAAFAALLAALYRLRLRQATRQVRMRMEVRLEERERIARDLHDTLLQSVQGLILKFDAVGKRIPRGDPARQAIEETLDRADEILAEGRDRVRSLRGSAAALSDLPAAFQRIAKEAAHGSATFRSVVEGRARDLDPTVLEESFSIGREALLNALAHSGALHVELEIAYDASQFRLRIRDDGRGIDPEVLGRGGRSDHWGLQGMRERARRIGANLELWSRPGAGTEVELKVPAATAYRSAPAAATTSWFRRSAGR
jgi:signal transduction histidine kinase/ligand-binding sensor domain-containing protein